MQKNSSNKLLIGIIVFLILLIIGGGGAAFWYLSKTPSSSEAIQTSQQQAQKSEDASLAEIGPLYPLTPITVNLKNKDEKDVYLKVTLSLELSSKLLANELDAKNAVIRDKIIKILSSKTLVDIDSELGKDKLCNAIKSSLNAMLTDGQIKNVYIVNNTIKGK